MASTPSGGEWLPSNKDSFDTPNTPPAAMADSASAPEPSPASAQPVRPDQPAPSTRVSARAAQPSGTRRVTFSALMAAILVAGTVGGAAGGAITSLTHGAVAPLAPRTASAAPPIINASPAIVDTSGIKAVYKAVSPAVVSVETSVATSARAGNGNGGPNGQTPRQRGNPNGPTNPNTPNSPTIPGLPNLPGLPSLPDFQASGEGTGFIIDADGDILTNYHVVEGSAKLTVTLADGTRLPAQVVGTDPGNDVALIKASIPAGKAAIANLGDSDAMEPGDAAIAIGTPFGLDHTLTAGIISAVNRDFGSAAGRPMRGLIQTDAAINPGNSGGPLLNANGEVIGITTSIESPVRANVGVGFAIPINQAKALLPQLKTGQKVQHAWLGISGTAVSADRAAELGLPSSVKSGVAVIQVSPGSPAATAGVRGGSGNGANATAGDVIVAVDGKTVSQVQDISNYLDTKRPGDTITITVLRDGQKQDLRATLAPWPDQQSS